MPVKPPVVSPELKELARILADWAASAKGATLYCDDRPDSDVDVYFVWGSAGDTDLDWWTKNNQEDFATINTKLPGRLQILELNDPLHHKIIAAPLIYEDRNVRCVRLPPKN